MWRGKIYVSYVGAARKLLHENRKDRNTCNVLLLSESVYNKLIKDARLTVVFSRGYKRLISYGQIEEVEKTKTKSTVFFLIFIFSNDHTGH